MLLFDLESLRVFVLVGSLGARGPVPRYRCPPSIVVDLKLDVLLLCSSNCRLTDPSGFQGLSQAYCTKPVLARP
jgi:hypothetical protein